MPFILASGSPRRHELLKTLVSDFTIEVSDIEEHLNPELKTLETQVEDLARQKAEVIARGYTGQKDTWVLGADTMVCLGSQALGKPRDAQEAISMLESLSNTSHQVITGLALIRCHDPLQIHLHHSTSQVTMRALTPEEIQAYVDSGEPMDKAGAYGIQGQAGQFITDITGEYENIVGLPLKALQTLFVRAQFL